MIVIYRAFDGKEFHDEFSCQQYEMSAYKEACDKLLKPLPTKHIGSVHGSFEVRFDGFFGVIPDDWEERADQRIQTYYDKLDRQRQQKEENFEAGVDV